MSRLPHNIEAERALLACCMIDETPLTIGLCQEGGITVDAFYDPKHKLVFESILAVQQKGMGIDEITVADHLNTTGKLSEVGGLSALNEITGDMFTAAKAPDFIAIVRDKHQRRELIKLAMQMAEEASTGEDAPSAIISRANTAFAGLSADKTSTLRPARETVKEALQAIQDEIENPNQFSGIATGLADLDSKLNGLRGGHLVIVAARPSVGKSSLARLIARNAAIPSRDGQEPGAVLFFGLEMSTVQTNMALLAMESKTPLRRICDGALMPEQAAKVAKAAERLAASPMYFEDLANLTIFDIASVCRRTHLKEKLGLVVIDYLQLLTPANRKVNREQQVAEASRNAKLLALELNVPVLLLSQLNRSSAIDNRPPRVEDLRESGAIEQDADTILLLHQKMITGSDGNPTPENPNVVQAIIGKQRGGAKNVSVNLTWLPEITRFENFANDSYGHLSP